MRFLFWALAGAALGWLMIYTQVLTAAFFRPGASTRVVYLVVGGAFFRWILVGILFAFALQHDVTAALFSFCGLWIMRRVLLYRINAGTAFHRWLA